MNNTKNSEIDLYIDLIFWFDSCSSSMYIYKILVNYIAFIYIYNIISNL